MKDAVVAQAVGVSESPFPHVGDAFHVGMRVHGPDGARGKLIVVEDAQWPNSHLISIAVMVEREVPGGPEPAPILAMNFLVEIRWELGHCAPSTTIKIG